MSAEIETAEPASTALARTTAVPTPEQRVDRQPRSRGLITGGLTLAVVSFSVAAPVGTLAVAPLGPQYTGLGVVIGVTAAVFGGLVALIVTKATELKTGPITATAVLWSAAPAQVLKRDRGADPDLAGARAARQRRVAGVDRVVAHLRFPRARQPRRRRRRRNGAFSLCGARGCRCWGHFSR